jgi:multisubunit Na+/H+ antiporter MnhC subunit
MTDDLAFRLTAIVVGLAPVGLMVVAVFWR